MAEMAKKLHFLKSGTEQTAKAYSTTAEAGSSYITNIIDGVTCYIPIGSTSDAQATIGRVLKGGTTYAIKSQAKPAYTEQSWTTAGSYTWTAPAGVTRVRVAVCGGGGGGCSSSSRGSWSGGSGGNSAFGNLISATGGGGGWLTLKDEYNSSADIYEPVATSYGGGSGGSPNGRAGAVKGCASGDYIGNYSCPGGTGFALSFSLANGGYGNGTSMTKSGIPAMISFAAGGSGGYNSNYVNVTPGSTYTITVGGVGSTNNKVSAYVSASSGNSGFVYIAYGGDI